MEFPWRVRSSRGRNCRSPSLSYPQCSTTTSSESMNFFFSLFNQRTPDESPREFRDSHGFVDIVLAATYWRGEARRGERLYRWQYRCRVKTILGATRCFHTVSHRRYQMLAVNWENISRTQRVGAWKLVNELNRDQGKKCTRFDCSLKCPRSSSRPLYSTLLLFPSPPFRIVRVQPSRMIKILLAEFLYRVFPSFFPSFFPPPSFFFPSHSRLRAN